MFKQVHILNQMKYILSIIYAKIQVVSFLVFLFPFMEFSFSGYVHHLSLSVLFSHSMVTEKKNSIYQLGVSLVTRGIAKRQTSKVEKAQVLEYA